MTKDFSWVMHVSPLIKEVFSNLKMLTCMHAKLFQSCLTLCDPMDLSLPGSSVHEDSPGKTLESPILAGRFFTTSATWEAMSFLLTIIFTWKILRKRNKSKLSVIQWLKERDILIVWFNVSFLHFYYCKIDHDMITWRKHINICLKIITK